MALQLSLSKNITNYSVLTVIDDTGTYNVTTNPSGWGAPNLALASINYAKLIITSPSATVYTIDIIADLGINFAVVTVNDLIYNVPSSLLGGTSGSTLDDGIWTVLYEVSADAGATKTTLTVQLATYYEVQALVFTKVATVPNFYTCEKCCSIKLKDVVTQFMMLQALIYASDYSYLTEFTNILSTIEQITSFSTDLICNC